MRGSTESFDRKFPYHQDLEGEDTESDLSFGVRRKLLGQISPDLFSIKSHTSHSFALNFDYLIVTFINEYSF